MSDPRRPTDGELFRHFRPGAGRPEPTPSKKSKSNKKWQPPPLGNAQLTLFGFARTNLKDWEAIALVRDIARWMNRPSGLVERHPDRTTVDKAFRKLLYKMSDGEAELHLRKLEERRSKARAATRAQSVEPSGLQEDVSPPEVARASVAADAPVVESQVRVREPESDFAEFLIRYVPRSDARAIVRLIAHDLGVDCAESADGDFEPSIAQFSHGHLSDARAEQFLAELRRRQTLGLPWIRHDKQELASQLAV